MKRIFLLLVLCCMYFHTAFAETELSKEDILADYDQLWMILENEYPFLPEVKARGIDVDALRAEGREILLHRTEDFEGFSALTAQLFARMGNVAHLQVVTKELYDSYYSQFIWPKSVYARYMRMEQREGQQITYPQAEARYLPEADALYFRFPTFSDPDALEGDRTMVADFLLKYPDAAHIIMDITGNRGGNAAYWIENIVAPFGGRYVWNRTNYLKKTAVTADIFENYMCEEIAGQRPAFVQQYGFTHLLRTTDVYPDSEGINAQGKRWVLIDEAVFSAADGFAAFCKATGWATLVGKRTMGDGGDAFAPKAAALERSGLLIRFSAGCAANHDGTSNAAQGTMPDVFCKPKETPLRACLRRIMQE